MYIDCNYGSYKKTTTEEIKMGQAQIITESYSPAKSIASQPSRQAYQILHFAFTIAPIAAGMDKFLNLLVDWTQYLPGFVNTLSGGRGEMLMYIVGVIEIAAGVGVWFKPRLFAYVVAAWLLLIIINLLLIPGYFDVALRDFGLALGAVALGRLSQEFAPENDMA
jgi:hypothetical protein